MKSVLFSVIRILYISAGTVAFLDDTWLKGEKAPNFIFQTFPNDSIFHSVW